MHKMSDVHLRLKQKLEARKDKRAANKAPNDLQGCLVTILMRIKANADEGFLFEEFTEAIYARILVQLLDATC